MKCLIIIPIHFADKTLKEYFTTRLKKAVYNVVSENMDIDIISLPQGATQSIECRSDLIINSPYVIAESIKAQAEGYEGIFVTDMDMCGVSASREYLSIPIIGGFQACAYTAMILARKFSINDSVVDMQIEHTRTFGIANNLASIRVSEAGVTELIEKGDKIADNFFTESLEAVEQDGAEAIIFGCTGLIGIAAQVKSRLSELGHDIPVIDPNQVAMSYLELLIKNKLYQSKITFTQPPQSRIHTIMKHA